MEQQNQNIPTESEIKGGKIVTNTNTNTQNDSVSIRRGRIGSVDVYEVTETELFILERGDSNTTHLSIAFFLLGSFVSLIIAIYTCTFTPTSKTVFYALTAGSLTGGLSFAYFWRKGMSDIKAIIDKVKSRL